MYWLRDLLWITGIFFILCVMLYLAWWIGCNVRITREKNETKRNCRHSFKIVKLCTKCLYYKETE